MSRPPRPGYPGGHRYAPPPPHYQQGYGPPGPGYADPSYYPPGPYGGSHPPPRYGGPPNDPSYYEYSSPDEGHRRNPRMGYGYEGSGRPGPSPTLHPTRGDESGHSDSMKRPDRSPYANDCEIVVLNKAQQQYGEMVERQVREMGLKVDIMFPKEDVKLLEFLKPIAKLGTIFAVIIDAENEKSQFLHFYQFRGVPKATLVKNVPLQIGKEMILKKYNELKTKEIGVVPENVKGHLKKLLEDQLLRDQDYTGLIRFLQERKTRQNAFLNRTSNVVQEHKSDVSSLVESEDGKELQKRIFAILDDLTDEEGCLKK